ncbi:hypothetical protein L2719_12730 [Shewanella schlegeliana]|uniref:Uncharacterized protein n=1 Tax=Shewanella schlegeliana TaxID=190308 RepID=A0ABS1T278_9GAMM|nr:hypothetical protein [Shewanella schlegeliana]MBL4914898.1 hypothetical protein [Shewanella schlegeliana]MCL1110411.1 hypothetical protein [Shewanella schlegeliana]GIU27779.1 hypothetical protein TUM4433_15210 [Shewanella schlegeliana]
MDTVKWSLSFLLVFAASSAAVEQPTQFAQQQHRYLFANLSVISNVSVGVGWSNHDYRDPWRWNVGVSNGWYGYPYGSRYYRPGYNWRWGNPYRYNSRYVYPYRYNRTEYKPSKPKVVAPPERATTSVSYSTGLTRLPDNARVIQREGRTVYEWQGVEYVYDWDAKTYRKIN